MNVLNAFRQEVVLNHYGILGGGRGDSHKVVILDLIWKYWMKQQAYQIETLYLVQTKS